MASTTKRRFTDEFKREAVSLWETSGRMQTEVAAELGIMPTMLRRWQRKLQESSASPARPAAKPPVSTMASPADQASEIARLRRELDPGADGARHFKKSRRHLCGDAAVKFAFIEQHASTWPVNVMCRMLGVSRSGYYDWRGRAPSARTTANLALLHHVRRLQVRHQGRYGSPRMHAALRAEGHRCSRGRVERLMRRHRIRALAGRRFRPCTTDSRHYLPIAPNVLAQRFVANAPNRIWLADITYIATGEGWLYLAAVLDLATRKVVGWAMREHMRTELPLAALMMAAQRQRPAPGLICHSDRGSQYAAGVYVDHLATIGAAPSMSRTGNCYDNAPMESFFHTLKVELVHQCRWATQAEARQALFGYIEGYYNRHRIHSALGYLTPEQAEHRMTG